MVSNFNNITTDINYSKKPEGYTYTFSDFATINEPAGGNP